jgi:prepilin-type processing-associated H-X9-DG protein
MNQQVDDDSGNQKPSKENDVKGGIISEPPAPATPKQEYNLLRIVRWIKLAIVAMVVFFLGVFFWTDILGRSFPCSSPFGAWLETIVWTIFITTPILAFVGLVFSLALLGMETAPADRRAATESIYIFLIPITIAIILFVLANLARDGGPRRITCINNLKQLGLVLGLYASENQQEYPPIDDTRNNFIFIGAIIYPEYLTDATILACPEAADYAPRPVFRLVSADAHAGFHDGEVHPDCITDISYCYLGWLITNDEEAKAFFEAYDKMSPADYGKDIVVPDGRGNGGGNIIYCLKSDEKLMEKIAQTYSTGDFSPIPVMWDKPKLYVSKFSHITPKLGGHVLYLDGHVEFVEYPGKFPMTETMARLLDERPRAPISDCE